MQYILSNPPEFVESVSSKAFKDLIDLRSNPTSEKDNLDAVCKVVKDLTALKGVGVATASLIASFVHPVHSFRNSDGLLQESANVTKELI
jgi:hypothetical protein